MGEGVPQAARGRRDRPRRRARCRLVHSAYYAMHHADRAINTMMDDRNLWDYEADDPPPQEARDAVSVARVFLETCAAKFGFPAP